MTTIRLPNSVSTFVPNSIMDNNCIDMRLSGRIIDKHTMIAVGICSTRKYEGGEHVFQPVFKEDGSSEGGSLQHFVLHEDLTHRAYSKNAFDVGQRILTGI